MPESVTLHENGTQRRFYFHKKIEETTSRTLSIFVHSARSLQRSRAVYISPFLFFPFPSLHSPLSPSLVGLVRVLFRPPCGEPANLLYTEFLVCRHTLRVSTLSVSPFLDVYICICVPPFPSPPPFSLSSVLPPRKPRRSSFFLSHFSTPFPVSSREYKKGWAHECLVTLSAFLIPPPYPTSAFACPACSSLSLYFSPTSNNHIYIYTLTPAFSTFFSFFLLFFRIFPFFSVRFWLRGPPPSVYVLCKTNRCTNYECSRFQPAPDLVASSMKLIRSAHRLHVVPPTQTVVIEHVSPGFTRFCSFLRTAEILGRESVSICLAGNRLCRRRNSNGNSILQKIVKGIISRLLRCSGDFNRLIAIVRANNQNTRQVSCICRGKIGGVSK